MKKGNVSYLAIKDKKDEAYRMITDKERLKLIRQQVSTEYMYVLPHNHLYIEPMTKQEAIKAAIEDVEWLYERLSEANQKQTLGTMQNEVAEYVKEKKWDQDDRRPLEMLMLIVTELAEIAEEHRKGSNPKEIWYDGSKPEGVPIEYADVLIRLLDDIERLGIDIQYAYNIKMNYNRTREERHGGKVI